MADKVINKEAKQGESELVSKVVRVILSNKRRATSKTKKRDDVSGGGRKPHRQKGTGRARAGSTRSPLWRGGGVVFGPTGDQNYTLSANKKEVLAARREVMEAKKADTHTIAVTKITKTKEAAALLKKNDISGKVLILAENLELKRCFQNIASLKYLVRGNENTFDVMWADKIVVLSTVKKAEVKEEKK
jgi:large subunit ribosomal protein L4